MNGKKPYPGQTLQREPSGRLGNHERREKQQHDGGDLVRLFSSELSCSHPLDRRDVSAPAYARANRSSRREINEPALLGRTLPRPKTRLTGSNIALRSNWTY